MLKVWVQFGLIILWVITGIVVLITFESIPKFVYGTLLFLYIIKMIEALLYRYEEHEKTQGK